MSLIEYDLYSMEDSGGNTRYHLLITNLSYFLVDYRLVHEVRYSFYFESPLSFVIKFNSESLTHAYYL